MSYGLGGPCLGLLRKGSCATFSSWPSKLLLLCILQGLVSNWVKWLSMSPSWAQLGFCFLGPAESSREAVAPSSPAILTVLQCFTVFKLTPLLVSATRRGMVASLLPVGWRLSDGTSCFSLLRAFPHTLLAPHGWHTLGD
jgi:hypothetical protein